MIFTFITIRNLTEFLRKPIIWNFSDKIGCNILYPTNNLNHKLIYVNTAFISLLNWHTHTHTHTWIHGFHRTALRTQLVNEHSSVWLVPVWTRSLHNSSADPSAI